MCDWCPRSCPCHWPRDGDLTQQDVDVLTYFADYKTRSALLKDDQQMVRMLEECCSTSMTRTRLQYLLHFPLEMGESTSNTGHTLLACAVQRGDTMVKSVQWLVDLGVCVHMGGVAGGASAVWKRGSKRPPAYALPWYTPLYACLFIKCDVAMAQRLCSAGAYPGLYGTICKTYGAFARCTVFNFAAAMTAYRAWHQRNARRRWCCSMGQ
jgi:hypothetical protein